MWVEKITSLFLTHSARQPCTIPLVHEIFIKWCWTKRKCTMHFNDDAEVTAPKYKSNLRCFCGFFSKDIPWFTSFSFYQLDFVFQTCTHFVCMPVCQDLNHRKFYIASSFKFVSYIFYEKDMASHGEY